MSSNSSSSARSEVTLKSDEEDPIISSSSSSTKRYTEDKNDDSHHRKTQDALSSGDSSMDPRCDNKENNEDENDEREASNASSLASASSSASSSSTTEKYLSSSSSSSSDNDRQEDAAEEDLQQTDPEPQNHKQQLLPLSQQVLSSTTKRKRNNKKNDKNVDQEQDDQDDEDDNNEHIDEEEELFRQNFCPGIINDVRRMRSLVLSSQLRTFDDALNPCARRILGFSYEGIVDTLDVFRGANIGGGGGTTTTNTSNNTTAKPQQHSVANTNDGVANFNNKKQLSSSASRSKSHSRKRQDNNNTTRDGKETPLVPSSPMRREREHDDDGDDANNNHQEQLSSGSNLMMPNNSSTSTKDDTNSNNNTTFDRNTHQHQFPPNNNTIHCNNQYKPHNTGLLRCFEPQVTNKRRNGYLQFSAAAAAAAPHPRAAAVGTCEDLIEFIEVRLALLCESLRHFEIFGSFSGLPDRCRVALHFVVCDERELPWNDANGVPLIVSKAKDVREWCVESMASLLVTSFSTMMTSSFIARASAQAVFEDVFCIEGSPNSLFSTQLLGSCAKYTSTVNIRLIKNNKQKKHHHHHNNDHNSNTLDPSYNLEGSVLRIDALSVKTLTGSVVQTLVDFPVAISSTSSLSCYSNESSSGSRAKKKEHKKNFFRRVIEKLASAVIEKVDEDFNGGDKPSTNADDAGEVEVVEKTKNSSNGNRKSASVFDLRSAIVDKEAQEQIKEILNSGLDLLKNELFDLVLLENNNATDNSSRSSAIFEDESFLAITKEVFEKQQMEYKKKDGHQETSNVFTTSDSFGDFLNVTYDQEEQQTESHQLSNNDDPLSLFAQYLPNLRDIETMTNLQRVLFGGYHDNNNNNNENKKINCGTSPHQQKQKQQAALPSSIVCPLSILLDLLSRLNHLYEEVYCDNDADGSTSSNTTTNGESAKDKMVDVFVETVLCQGIASKAVAPFVFNRFINPDGLNTKGTESQTIEALKTVIHEDIKSSTFFQHTTTTTTTASKSSIPFLANLSAVPKLIVELLMVSGRASLFSMSCQAYRLCRREFVLFSVNKKNYYSHHSLQHHRLFTRCVLEVRDRLREEAYTNLALKICSGRIENNLREDSAENNNDKTNKLESIKKTLRSKFKFDDVEEALYFVAVSDESDKMMIAPWE